MAAKTSLLELALLFARLGATSFGGPAAHVALMRHEVVLRRKWLDDQAFTGLYGATNLIPGPNSTELAMHLGAERAGGWGLVVAGCAFIVPAALITGLLAWLYVVYGALPQAAGLLAGLAPVVAALVAHALSGLAASLFKRDFRPWLVGAGSVAALLLGVHELAVLGGAGLLALLLARVPFATPTAALLPLALAAPAVLPTPLGLFAVFLKIGSVLFGSGYVLVAFLRTELVERLHWLTPQQLTDAVAAGQVTPGPVFSTATFVGGILAGPWGAVAATLGIFLPAFVFVALSRPILARLTRSPAVRAFLGGVNAASLALMGVVLFDLIRAACTTPWSIALGVACLAVLLTTRLNPTWLIAAGAVVGLVAGPHM
jgi:chromate transporter